MSCAPGVATSQGRAQEFTQINVGRRLTRSTTIPRLVKTVRPRDRRGTSIRPRRSSGLTLHPDPESENMAVSPKSEKLWPMRYTRASGTLQVGAWSLRASGSRTGSNMRASTGNEPSVRVLGSEIRSRNRLKIPKTSWVTSSNSAGVTQGLFRHSATPLARPWENWPSSICNSRVDSSHDRRPCVRALRRDTGFGSSVMSLKRMPTLTIFQGRSRPVRCGPLRRSRIWPVGESEMNRWSRLTNQFACRGGGERSLERQCLEESEPHGMGQSRSVFGSLTSRNSFRGQCHCG